MPYRITRHNDGLFSVKNIVTGRVLAKHTTLKKAEAQVRLLHAIEKVGIK